MTKYFQKFPLLYYPSGSDFKLATDILRRVKFTEKTKANGKGFLDYTIKDGDTADNIASRFYGASNLHWIVLILNDMINPYYDWPLRNETFEGFVTAKYGAGHENDVREQRLLSNGTIVDISSELLLEDGEPLILEGGPLDGQVAFVRSTIDTNEPIVFITNRLYELEKNELKRKIKLLRPEFVSLAVAQLQKKI